MAKKNLSIPEWSEMFVSTCKDDLQDLFNDPELRAEIMKFEPLSRQRRR